jgi:hypothetical protein
MILLLGMFTNPIFAEVTSLQTNNELFYNGDQIEFSGTVESGSMGLVTIVIRDQNNEFVLLTQAIINHDDSFEKSVKIKNKFTEHGAYNATGFILNMTKGVTTNFGISLNGASITDDDKNTINKDNHEIIDNKEITINEYEEEKYVESVVNINNADFVDPAKDPYHYVERYYSEPAYKSWFDRNYPGQTIEETVGYTDNIQEIKTTVQEIIDKEIIPEAQASSIVEPIQKTKDNSDIAQVSLAIAGLGILFGAVYGVKRQVDHNVKQISINKDTIRKRIISPILGSTPKEIIQTRLAKGEITLEEYEKLRIKLN